MTPAHSDMFIPRLNIKIYAFHKFKKEIVSKIFRFSTSLEFRAQKVRNSSKHLNSYEMFIGAEKY